MGTRTGPGSWARPDPRSEKAAIRHVWKHLRARGYTVRSKEREICGYDLHATHGTEELHVEVKGCAGSMARFFLSRTERNAGKDDPDWRLVVVTNASSRPNATRFLRYREVERVFDLEPTQWEGRSKSGL